MNRNIDYHIVMVYWNDARGVSSDWTRLSEIKKEPMPDICRVVSIGYLIENNDEGVVIVPHIGIEKEERDWQVCGDFHIPRSAITKIIKLKILGDSNENIK